MSFRSHPHSRLHAQKGVLREGLDALLLTLEHFLLKHIVRDSITNHPHIQLQAQKGVQVGLVGQKSRSGGPSAYFIASFTKHSLAMVRGCTAREDF